MRRFNSAIDQIDNIISKLIKKDILSTVFKSIMKVLEIKATFLRM